MKRIFLILFLFCIQFSIKGQTVTNGSITGAPVGNNVLANAAGWSVCGFSPDLCDTGFPSYSGGSTVTPSFSPDGGSWLGMAAVGAGECAQTTVTGLTVGDTYTLCFYGACFGTNTTIFNSSPSNPQICVGGTCQTFTIPMAANTWTLFTMTFTAAATTETLQCILTGDDSYCALDGFTISIPGATADWTDPSPICSSAAPINLDALVTGTAGGVWTGTGVTGNTFDPGSGTQAVTYTVNPGGCDEVSQTITITVGGGANGAWTLPTGLCDNGTPIDLNALITGDLGGVWSGTGVSGNTFDPSSGSQNVTYSVGVAPCDDVVTQLISVSPFGDASWTPPVGLCTGDAPVDLNTLVTGTTGGTWSGIGVIGSTFDPTSGTQVISYTVGPVPCDDVSTQTINVSNGAIATWNPPIGVCDNDAPIDLDALVTGTTGGTWSGVGVTGNTFDPGSGSQMITYSVGLVPCDATSSQMINVSISGDASWTPPVGLCTGDAPIDLNTLITGTAGGTWTGTGVTGSNFDPAAGTQSITYTVGTAPCDDVSTQTITITNGANADWNPPTGICDNDGPINLDALVTGTVGGIWSGVGVTGNTFDPVSGSQMITYTVGAAPCDATSAQMINVDASGDATWTPPLGLCTGDAPLDLNALITGTAGGTWSGTGVTGSTFDPSSGTQLVTYTVGSGGCQDVLALPINVDPAADASWTTLSLCATAAPYDLTAQITGDLGGIWTGTGLTGSTFDPGAGTQSVTYTVGSGGCQASSTQTVSVGQPQVDVTTVNVSCFGAADGTATANVTGGSGNYTFAWTPGGQNTQTVNGLSPGSYTVTVNDVTLGCADDVNFDILEPNEITGVMTATNACSPDLGTASVAASGGAGGFTYAWNNSTSTSSSAINLDSAMHIVVVTDNNGCTYTDSILVQIFPPVSVSTFPNANILYGECAPLGAAGAVTYQWESSDDLTCEDCQSPIACPPVTTTYCVTGIDGNGCIDTACMKVNVEIVCGEVFVPSAFSPNGDEENDLLCIYSDCLEQFTFTIYNRWGERVFETSDMSICWDGSWKGKQLNPAVFVYTVNGFLINGESVSQKGNISLIR